MAVHQKADDRNSFWPATPQYSKDRRAATDKSKTEDALLLASK